MEYFVMSVDLHRHDMFSRFDGFGKPDELAKIAKKLGYTALGTSNHGNTNGLVQTYNACKKEGIKPILGVEGYFIPVYKQQEKGYHLCLFAKDLKGYKNLNTIQYKGELQKYYNPIWTFDLLEKYHDGLICTTACAGSYSSKCILTGNVEKAVKYLRKLKDIFSDDLYIEIQPYKISEPGAQEKINAGMINLSEKLGIKCILTSDSHRGMKTEFNTYLKMHAMDKHDIEWVRGTYEERYMPPVMEMEKRFVDMHMSDYGKKHAYKMAMQMHNNLEELEEKVDPDILGKLEIRLPKISGSNDSWKDIVCKVKEGLKNRGKYTKEYIERCKKELDVIKSNGFVDYFLIVADYTNWAKEQGIYVGPGRGSVCNCLVAYAMHITEVDSIRFGLDFRRFMRYDKKAFPDIDLDFEMDRRGDVIEYLINKYPGQSARVSIYSMYQIDNTINELSKVCGLDTDKSVEEHEAKQNKEVINDIKNLVKKYKLENNSIDRDALLYGQDKEYVKLYNTKYDNIITHFLRLYGKVRFIGTHAAGVVITSGEILQYTSLRVDKQGNIYSAYNLDDLNSVNIIKFDLLGLKTMQGIGECRKLSGKKDFDISIVDDKKLIEQFREGNTCGVFQLEKKAAKKILSEIDCSDFNDIIATTSMNRPAALHMKSPELYGENKRNWGNMNHDDIFLKYTSESYGVIIYQEQLMYICVYIGGFEWHEADKILKANKHGDQGRFEKDISEYREKTGVDLRRKFLTGCRRKGIDKENAIQIWDSLSMYAFNKGHAVGYSLISLEEMYYKIYYPNFFWYVKIKYASDEKEREEFSCEACKSGSVIFLPHVNYSLIYTGLRKVDGEYILQQGLADLKGVGEKAAAFIYEERKKNGVFVSYDNFYDRCVGRVVNKKVLNILTEQGALEFNKKVYIRRVTSYNTALYSRSGR